MSKPKEAHEACHNTNRARHAHHVPRQPNDSHRLLRQFGETDTYASPQQMG